MRALDSDLPGWSSERGGRALPGLETSLVPIGAGARERSGCGAGPSVCLGTLGWGSGEPRATWSQDGGWLEVGKVVRRDDGRGLHPVRRIA